MTDKEIDQLLLESVDHHNLKLALALSEGDQKNSGRIFDKIMFIIEESNRDLEKRAEDWRRHSVQFRKHAKEIDDRLDRSQLKIEELVNG